MSLVAQKTPWTRRRLAGVVLVLGIAAAGLVAAFFLAMPACEGAWARAILDKLVSAGTASDGQSLTGHRAVATLVGERTCQATRQSDGSSALLNYRIYRSGWSTMLQITSVVPATGKADAAQQP